MSWADAACILVFLLAAIRIVISKCASPFVDKNHYFGCSKGYMIFKLFDRIVAGRIWFANDHEAFFDTESRFHCVLNMNKETLGIIECLMSDYCNRSDGFELSVKGRLYLVLARL